MDEFRGTVSLSKPFLEQQEIADFLQISPQASFPRVILYRLLSVAEGFIQARLSEQTSESELVSLRLNCEFLKKGSLTESRTQEPETIGFYWVAWGSKATYDEILDPETVATGSSPEIPLVHEELDQLTSRIYEVLMVQAPHDLKEQIDIVAFLDINLTISESIIETSPVERLLKFPRNFRTFRLEEGGIIRRRFYLSRSNPCCSTNITYKRLPDENCDYHDPC
jgi:hypothetical protein